MRNTVSSTMEVDFLFLRVRVPSMCRTDVEVSPLHRLGPKVESGRGAGVRGEQGSLAVFCPHE